jgi:vanillate O-demethylase monooxygenase subunit
VYLKNAWYVAALDAELTDALYPARLLGQNIVLYRTERGDPVALENACPHRKLPLSMGRLIADQIQCGYHGLRFDASGRCVLAPGSPKIPSTARVRSYPVVSRYGLVWVWMGDVSRANSDLIFPVERWNDAGWGRNQPNAMTLACNYLYVTDNLLDPSHVAWVHRTSFGDDACGKVPVQVTVKDNGVVASRWIKDVEAAPFYSPFLRFQGKCDRLQHYEVRFPSHAIIKAVFVPAGTSSDGAGAALHDQAFIMDSYNFMTPIDEIQTRYFWFQVRNFSPGDDQLDRTMTEAVRSAFEEDRVILSAVQRGFAESSTPNIDLATDAAPLRFRRRLAEMIAQESL